MKSRNWFMTMTCVMLATALMFVTASSNAFSAHAESAEVSRLIGVLITTQDISLFAGDEGVLWASVVPGTSGADTQYEFKNSQFEPIGGLRFLCFIGQDENGESNIITNVDDGICKADFNFENESSLKMEGTLLYAPKPDDVCFFYNPVFLAEDDRVFAVPGDFLLVNGDMNPLGALVGLKLRDERKHFEDGQEITDVTVVNLEIKTVREPLKMSLLQFNEAHELLKAEEYAPGTVPEKIVPLVNTDYLLLETQERGADGVIVNRREIFGRQEDFLNTLSCREDGICIQQYHEIIWTDDE